MFKMLSAVYLCTQVWQLIMMGNELNIMKMVVDFDGRVGDDDVFQVRDRPLIEKYYPSGKKFLTMFPDGTGNVLYPCPQLNFSSI